ncbi:hypothetical protein DPMN_011371 [Dreissena polymorpha]|uniref:Uncharacterized protein n=1 Tax=Dreissena polymorpha TaxID=45954 RepID=A0A9D4S1S8_DREPO|nr:hypothetical protein DPMN_011371 [Dreissena polymorpha]
MGLLWPSSPENYYTPLQSSLQSHVSFVWMLKTTSHQQMKVQSRSLSIFIDLEDGQGGSFKF